MPYSLAKHLCDFVDASPTAYHAVENIACALEARGAIRLREHEAWALEPGATYYVIRGGSALVAFRPGLRPASEEGFALAGAHTDSPALKARLEKPLSARGFERVPIEVYGGPILATWLDRPLSLAGRVALRGPAGALETRLVNFARPVGIVPNLAIHLNRDLNKGFEYNAQTQLPVLLGADPAAVQAETVTGSALLRLIAKELGVEPDSVLGADLFFVDAQRCTLFGVDGELVNGYRLDDLSGCHAVLEGFLRSSPAPHGQIACFLDHEEVGSTSRVGADSSLIRDLLARIAVGGGLASEGFYRALARSFAVSVDVAQAYHPSYAEKFDEYFAPLLNGGPAIKVNANMRYATDAGAEARFRTYCAEAGVPCQKFMSRADIAPGSTIGPVSSALTGIPTVDVGAPLLSMHSIRETIGARDHEAMAAVLARHFGASPFEGA